MSEKLVYSEVMEDDAVVSAALELGAGEVAVVVASAGDNVFHAALDGARVVHGVDVSARQTAFSELKAAAAAALPWRDLAALVGSLEATAKQRAALLDKLPDDRVSAALGAEAETRAAALEHGLASCGTLAAFVAPLSAGLAEAVGAGALERILTEPDPAQRAQLWRERFEQPGVTDFLAAALNADTITGDLMPSAAFEQESAVPFHAFYLEALRRLVVEGDPTRNHFLHRLWRGRYPAPDAVPRYLGEANHARLQATLPAIEWHTADLTAFLSDQAAESVDAFNLSNVADWMDDEAHAALWSEVSRVAAPGARVFLRSFLADRPPHAAAGAWHADAAANAGRALADRVGYFARCELWRREGEPRTS